ncbi:MAG: hypothetical protein AMJ79_12085 [Phycisphaerae bacterium SM23_30]|nr:MAG: hypothetical protein AMJ79_12085 [Phycisphaerae bacterium SM23_30]
MVISPLDNLNVLRNVSSKMTLKKIKSCIRSLKEFRIQSKIIKNISPYWGIFTQIAKTLPGKYFEDIRRVVNLEYFGDISKPTSVIIKLDPRDYVKLGKRWVRAIKIKGITDRLIPIKKRKLRHIRFLGQGNMPFLLPYTNPNGTREDFRFDVGEPYRAKRFRSVINEVILSQYALLHGCAVMVPIGMGIYEDDELLYKGEPIAFSIWGVEHPDDTRSGDELDARYYQMLDEMDVSTSNEDMWKAFQGALSWVRQHHAQIITEMRQFHEIGLVHHEVHFNNTLLYDASLTIADWEEAAHRRHLSRCQFLDSIMIDLVRLIEQCCSEEAIYRPHYYKLSGLEKKLEGKLSLFPTTNYFMYYFHEHEVNEEESENLLVLQEVLLTEWREKDELIESMVGKLVLDLFDKGRFGKGIDWKNVARPFMPGFSDDHPVWQPDAKTTFDLQLFVQKGGWPYGKKKKYPTQALRRAEGAIYEGRFEDAIKIYESILRYGHKRNRDFDSYIYHNLASLYFALCQDEKAKTYFDRKAFP